jgi:acetate kinase
LKDLILINLKSKNYENFSKIVAAPHYLNAATLLIDLLEKNSIDLVAAGHRIVHGGLKYHKPELVTVELMENLHLLIPLDPEHLEGEILLIEAFRKKFPHLVQVACLPYPLFNTYNVSLPLDFRRSSKK